jgi:hypothetical protein
MGRVRGSLPSERGGRRLLFLDDNRAIAKTLETTGIDVLSPMSSDAAEADCAGLGLLMICSFADRLTYHYADGRKHVTFAVRWAETGELSLP